MRPDWDEYFIRIANVVAQRSTCLRSKFGAVIVSPDKQIISTGYNGAPSGVISCCDKKICYRQENNIPSGTRYETCYSVHAEANAIVRSKSNVSGCTLYIGDDNNRYKGNVPCFMCRRLMANAGIIYCCYLDHNGQVIKEDIRITGMNDLRGII
jgi:dCMP deaminase